MTEAPTQSHSQLTMPVYSLASPLAISPTLSPSDSPLAPPSTPNPLALASSVSGNGSGEYSGSGGATRARNSSAPLTPASSSHARLSPPMSIVTHNPCLASQYECDESEEKESATPLSASDAATSQSSHSPFTSFSARLAAAKRKSPVPRLEIKIDSNSNDGESTQGQSYLLPAGSLTQQTSQTGHRGKIDEIKENRNNTIQAVPETPLGARTPQNSPMCPQSPVLSLDMTEMTQSLQNIAYQLAQRGSPMRKSMNYQYTNLASYQPITPTQSPVAPHTPGPCQSPTFASQPLTPAPLTPSVLAERDPPPSPMTPSVASNGPKPRISPLMALGNVNALPPSSRPLTRSVSQGPPLSSSPKYNYLEDQTPNTPFYNAPFDPATPINTPNPLYSNYGQFSVGLQSIPPSPSPFNGILSQAASRGYQQPGAVPNTPIPVGAEPITPISATSFNSMMMVSNASTNPSTSATNPNWQPQSPTLAAIQEQEPPRRVSSGSAASQPAVSVSAVVAASLTSPSIAPAVSYLLLTLRSLGQTGLINENDRIALTDDLLNVNPIFLAILTSFINTGANIDNRALQATIQEIVRQARANHDANSGSGEDSEDEEIIPSLHLTSAQYTNITNTLRRLRLPCLSLTDLWNSFESESAFDELTQSAYTGCIHRLIPSLCVDTSSVYVVVSAMNAIYSALNSAKSNQNAYVSWNELLTVLAVFSKGSPHEKLTFIFQIFDSDSNNAIQTKQIQKWTENFFTLLELFSEMKPPRTSTGSSVSVRAKVMLESADVELKGKINLSRWLSWTNSPIHLLIEHFQQLYQ